MFRAVNLEKCPFHLQGLGNDFLFSNVHWPKKWSNTLQWQIMPCILKPRSCMEAISQVSMISWAKMSTVGFLAFIASIGIKVTILKGLRRLNHFTSVQNLLWDLEYLASKDFSIVGPGHPHINFLIPEGLEGSELPWDYQKYNAVILKLKKFALLIHMLFLRLAHTCFCIYKTQTTDACENHGKPCYFPYKFLLSNLLAFWI